MSERDPKAKGGRMTTKEALLLVLDQVDYTAGACSPTDMVAACLPAAAIKLAREALASEPDAKRLC